MSRQVDEVDGGDVEVGGVEGGPRRSRRALWTALAVGAVVALLVAVLATRPAATTRAAESPLLGRPAPALDGTTVDGTSFSGASLRGRWVLVNFFATWCVPCRQEHDDLLRFRARHLAAGDAEVVGVVYDDSVGSVRDFRRDEGGDWPFLTDDGGRIALDFGVEGVPESFLVSPDGVVAARIVGGVRVEELEALLARVAGARPPRDPSG